MPIELETPAQERNERRARQVRGWSLTVGR